MPDHLDEVWDILEKKPEAILYAGGTDLLVRQRASKSLEPPAKNCNSVLAGQALNPRTLGPLICLADIHELKEIYQQGNFVFIGSCVTHTKLIENRLIQKCFPVLIKALKVLGSPPVRNMGTIGGNICTASPAGDTLPPLYTLGAIVETRSIDGNRFVPLKSFIKGPGKTVLQKSEIVYGVWINTDQDYTICHYEKVGQRKALAIAIASLAVMLKLSESGIIEKASLAWGSVAPTIVTSRRIEKALIGKPLTTESLMPVISLVEKAVSPIDDVRASADYRRMVAGNLLFRLLQYRNHGSF
jgi:xanthine dehydrogenase FAD-binding subunit